MNRLTEISARQILGLLENSFDMIDPRLIGHELRTACSSAMNCVHRLP